MNTRSYSPGRIPAAPECGDIIKEDKLSESKYTPGPWKVVLSPQSGEINVAAEEDADRGLVKVVAKCYADEPDNASLIAAAPDLLWQAKDTLAALEELGYHAHPPIEKNHIKRLRAAIAKAEGK